MIKLPAMVPKVPVFPDYLPESTILHGNERRCKSLRRHLHILHCYPMLC